MHVAIWEKLTRVVLFLFFIAYLILVAFWYLPLIQQNERMRKQTLHLETELRREEEASKHLRMAIDALRNNPKAIERLSRERLGYAKPDETVIRFESPPAR